MTREEQIYKEAEGRCIDLLAAKERGDANTICPQSYRAGFMDGARWADSHPRWIPVEERLPKENQSVFICNARHDYGTALYQGGEWCITREYVAINVTHWMEIVPPRKED